MPSLTHIFNDLQIRWILQQIFKQIYRTYQFRAIRIKKDCTMESDRTNHDIIPTSPLERFKPLQVDLKKRLNTFKNYPKNAVKSKEDLADNGFHYTGDGKDDKVQCVFCGITINNWTKEDDITSEHRRFSGDCMHIYQLDRKNFGSMMNGGLSRADLIVNSLKCEKNGRLPQMKDLTLRLNSFRDWKYPIEEKPSPEAMAKAGLFYTGK